MAIGIGSKCVILGCLMICLLVCMNLIEGTNARSIGYGSIERGNKFPQCNKKHPEFCTKLPGNHYTRGCEGEERCRKDGPGGEKGDYDEDIVKDRKGGAHGKKHTLYFGEPKVVIYDPELQ